MLTLLIIAGIILFIIIIANSNKNEQKQKGYIKRSESNYKITDADIEKSINKPSITSAPKIKTVEKFSDKKEFLFEDYSHLSASEARREMKERKDNGEWLEFEEYGGYMNAIYDEKDYVYIEKIEKMTAEQTEKWFIKQKDSGKWITTGVYDVVAQKLKPHHEEYLLKEMDKTTPGRIEGWINARKKEGYFFSDLAYEKADKILSGEIDNRKVYVRKKIIKS